MTTDTTRTPQTRCGLVALVGPPNVGKSTLMNRFLGQKIAIVTPKPQTTRNRILGIVNGPDYQVVMLDTPGLHRARSPLNREMVRIALNSLDEVDVILFMIDAAFPPPDPARSPTRYLEGRETPAILAVNKIDTVSKSHLLPVLAAYEKLHPFTALVPISALTGDGTDILLQEILKLLKPGPRLYPEDIPTDASERFIVAEMIREQVFLATREELPYATAVLIDAFQEEPERNRSLIHATIMVEKKSQKGIIIGKQGRMLATIGSRARQEIERLLGQKVVLKLWVKVEKDWSRNPRVLRELGVAGR